MAQCAPQNLFRNAQHSESQYIPMAQRLLDRFLLTISFDKPNGAATIAQTYFDNIF